MATPSSQVLASWAKEELQSNAWVPLREVCIQAIKARWAGVSETQLYEVMETNLTYIAEHLRDEAAEWMIDGTSPAFEIDDDPSPYVRSVTDTARPVLLKLRRISPFSFEDVCAQILRALGADAQSTKKTNDGGIDFHALRLKVVPSALTLPEACKAAVIGQAKRYKDGNLIKETAVREFVGAAMLRIYELQRDAGLSPLAPVILAFWTTSDFDPNAKRFARALGLWYMDGKTLANYISHLNMTDTVMNLPDVPDTPPTSEQDIDIGKPILHA